MKQWYEALFENYGHQYDQEPFTKGTSGECDFIEQEIQFNKDARILDIGCGTGRHAIELTKRGYAITGIDLSESQLNRAREKATQQNVKVDFRQQDARELSFINEFDLVLMLCEGAFPLMETDEMNYQILRNASLTLKEDGKIILTTLNGLFPLFHSVKEFINAESSGNPVSENTFDLMTFRDHSVYETEDDEGQKLRLYCNERYYVPSEITWLLKTLGFQTIDVFGAKLGAFSRDDPLTIEDYEMLVIAERRPLIE